MKDPIAGYSFDEWEKIERDCRQDFMRQSSLPMR